ncbi:MarR family transcriptional regulator [Deinococcus irradiatisoli]|uniref:MarR family transcriptional regulator n=1 Tax=Deinococcus irradiatisoli TaxID=2202254 RepID=A0A2Z3JJC4_9DEIO|nr:MarR family transcriptional regulator [Deinococcus irradiatisoli]AWN24086.1 MarR family transcriptional regulator [Deinococcus irradiatisoli]
MTAVDTDLSAALAADLRLLLGQLQRRLRAEVPPGDLTHSQLAVMFHLERGEAATVTELARAEGVRPQSMGATVAALQQLGLVVGGPHASDKRRTTLRLSAAGHALIAQRRAAREDWLQRTLRARLLPGEQADLARSVELLRRLVRP